MLKWMSVCVYVMSLLSVCLQEEEEEEEEEEEGEEGEAAVDEGGLVTPAEG